MTFRDSTGDDLGSVGLLTPRWVRQWWSSDALLPDALTLFPQDDSRLYQYLWQGQEAEDQVTPKHAAATDSAGVEHAMGDRTTLCGLPEASVVLYRHHFRFGSRDCSDCYRIAWDRHDTPVWPEVLEGGSLLSSRWADVWGATPPIGHLLRGGETWVRFHSLPESKRYADTAEEYDELLRRHHIVLDELGASGEQGLVLVMTTSWSCSRLPVPQSAALQAAVPGSRYWASFQDPTDPESDSWWHVFVNRLSPSGEALDPLLRLVADDGTAGVVISDSDLTWFFHPYDGGADVIPATSTERDEFTARHAGWLPTNDAGL